MSITIRTISKSKPKKYYPANLLIVLLLALGWFLSSCSDGSSSPLATSSTSVNSSNTSSKTQSSSALPVAPLADYNPEKTFIFGLGQEPVGFSQVGFDPANLTDNSSLIVTRQIFEGLFQFKPNSMGIEYSSFVRGVIASPDGLSYRIRLRKGIVFSDGTLLDASVVKFNFDRWSTFNIYHKGDFDVWKEFWGGFPGNLQEVDVLDNIDVVVRLKTPMASFYQVLAMPQFAIVSPSSFDANGNFQQPIGSGPYKLEKVMRDAPRYLVLTANDNYTVQREDINSLPKLSTIVVQVLAADQDGLKEIKDHHISATDKVPPEEIGNSDASYNILYRDPPLNVTFLTMNQDKPPFNNLLVREAFADAINQQDLISTAFLGLGEPANELLSPSTLGYDNTRQGYTYDPTQAKQLLVQAGYGSGLRVDLWRLPDPRPYYPDTEKVAEAITNDLAKINVTVQIRSEDWATFYQDRDDGNLAFYLNGWQGMNGDPDEFFQAIFSGNQRATGYANATLTDLIQRGGDLSDLAARRDLYRQALDIVQHDVPAIPLAFVKIPLAVSSNVVGYVPNPSGIDDWANISLK